MFEIPVFRKEMEAGIGDAVRTSTSLAHACEIQPWDAKLSQPERDWAVARLRTLMPERARASLDDFDLHFLQTVLATTGWNKNDDVFDPLEMWTARHTPAHKPFNYEHNCAHIIGHIITNWAMGDDGKALAEDTAADDLPVKFHVATGGVLYKCWNNPDLQERMDGILEGIAKGEWFVSMECLFKGFDYALRAADGSTRAVARNEQTAFLTKYLRAYGGTGEYDGQKVGRLLRKFVFSGKGLVRNPANPESVILTDTQPFSTAKASLLTDVAGLSAGKTTSVDAMRTALVKSRLGLPGADAAEFVSVLSALSHEEFVKRVELTEKLIARANPVVRKQAMAGPASPANNDVHKDIAAYFGVQVPHVE